LANETYTHTDTDSLLEHLRRATIGRYDVYAELGTGGMASVFLALDLALDRKVAIKVMSPALASSHDNIERFKREAKVAASLNHPNIIGILAVGDDPDLAYFVMKYVEGRSLESVIKEGGAQSVPFVQTVIGASGKALHYAHTRGVVHRDVKPANFMLDQDGWLIVTDFGIAKMEDTKGLTMTGSIIGTPYYMSPEQFNGKAVTGATDQYALGVLAYEMLTGKQPYTGETIAEVMRGHLFDDVPSVRAVRPEVPEGIDHCVRRMMAKDPKERFAHLEDAVMAFGAVAPSVEVEIRTQIISLAKSGMQAQPRMSMPLSPVPANRPPKPSKASTAKTKVVPQKARRGARAEAPEDHDDEPALAAPRSKMPMLIGLLLFVVGVGGATAWLRPDLVETMRASIAGPSVPAVDPLAVLRDSIETARLARVAADSAARADSIALVVARADSIVRADSVSRANAAALAARSAARRSAATPPRTTPAAAAATPATPPAPSIPPVGGGAPPAGANSSPTAGAATPANAAAKDGTAGSTPTRSSSPPTIPTVGAERTTPPPAAAPATATATGPGTIRIGSRIPLAVLYLGDEVRPIGEQGIQTLSFPAGPVRISIRADKCAAWDTTFTVVAGQTHTIGYRPVSC
jgi:serine/threonine-protein kinase